MTTTPDPARGMHRHGGHDTSRQAALAVLSKKTELQRLVLSKFVGAGSRGLTHYELEELCDDHGSTMRTRCAELVEQGLVIDSGEKRRINGRLRTVWRLRTPEDDEAGDLVDLMQGGRVNPIEALLGRGFQSTFADADAVENYLRANGFRLAGEDQGVWIHKTPKGHRFRFTPGDGPIVGTLDFEAAPSNRGAEPRLTDDTTVAETGEAGVPDGEPR